jgi:hypothetical protein
MDCMIYHQDDQSRRELNMNAGNQQKLLFLHKPTQRRPPYGQAQPTVWRAQFAA